MTKRTLQLSAIAALIALNSTVLSSCKDKKKTETNTEVVTPPVQTIDTTPAQPQAPVVISADDSLKMKLVDATKDFPNVKTTVNDGIVTVTGEVQRASLKKLIESIHALHPKKVENQLTIK